MPAALRRDELQRPRLFDYGKRAQSRPGKVDFLAPREGTVEQTPPWPRLVSVIAPTMSGCGHRPCLSAFTNQPATESSPANSNLSLLSSHTGLRMSVFFLYLGANTVSLRRSYPVEVHAEALILSTPGQLTSPTTMATLNTWQWEKILYLSDFFFISLTFQIRVQHCKWSLIATL